MFNRLIRSLQNHSSLYVAQTTFIANFECGNRITGKYKPNDETIRVFSTQVLNNSSDDVNYGLLKKHPNDFITFLKDRKISRCYILWDKENAVVRTSHDDIQELADWCISDVSSGYRQHEAVFMQLGVRTGCLMSAFMFNTNRGQAYGSTRIRDYKSMDIFLREGLKWSQMIGYKTALGGLWVGGGNSIIAEPSDKKHCMPEFRQKLFYDYGEFISGLNGCYIASEGMGLHVHDINNIHSRTRFVNCISEDIGGSGNPCIVTGKGIILGMEAALESLGIGCLEGKRIAVQGAGNIGYIVISELLDRGVSEVYVADCNQKRLDDVYDTLAVKAHGRLNLNKVSNGDEAILSYDCDILAPCASSYVLTERTIPNVKAKIICGAANNQLASPISDCQLLVQQGTSYVVDFLVNRMAIVNTANEAYGRLPFDPAVSRHLNKDDPNSIYQQTKTVLEMSKDQGMTSVEAAYKLAEERCQQSHPIWPGRSQQIVNALVSRKWHEGVDFWRKRRNFTGFGGDA